VNPHYRIRVDTLAREIAGELVLVNVASDKIFVANQTGARLWRGIEAQCDLPALIADITAMAPAPPAAREEVNDFIAALLREGFIEDLG